MAFTLHPNANEFVFVLDTSGERMVANYDTDGNMVEGSRHQNIDEETGLPEWNISVLFRTKDMDRSQASDSGSVRILAPTDPSLAVQPFQPIAFEDLQIDISNANAGRRFVTFRAKGIKGANQNNVVSQQPQRTQSQSESK